MTYEEYKEALYNPGSAPENWKENNASKSIAEANAAGGGSKKGGKTLTLGKRDANGNIFGLSEEESNSYISYLNQEYNSYSQRMAQIQNYISNGAFTTEDQESYGKIVDYMSRGLADSLQKLHDEGLVGYESVYTDLSKALGDVRSNLNKKTADERTDTYGAYKDADKWSRYVQSLQDQYSGAKQNERDVIDANKPTGFERWAMGRTRSSLKDNEDYKAAQAASQEAKDKLDYARGIQDTANYFIQADKDAALTEKYEGASYDDVQNLIAQGSEDAEWLKAHQFDDMFLDNVTRDRVIAEKEAQLADLEKQRNDEKLANVGNFTYDAITDSQLQTRTDTDYQIAALQRDISKLKNDKYFSDKSSYYDELKKNADYNENSTGGFVSDSDSENVAVALQYMTDDERKTYSYLLNAQGREAADKYLDEYLKYDLNQRASQAQVEKYQRRAEEHEVFWSAASVPMNILSGAGYLNVLGQNVANSFSDDYKPIDYYNPAMQMSRNSSTIRGTVSSKLADEYGTINLDENEHPYLARFLNGKSYGDVYQLGMSSVDSFVLAHTPLGAASSIFLAGSAASQGILDALEKGATDEQALAMGTFNGIFEALFEYVSMDKLLKNPNGVVKAFFQQAGVEGSEEIFTSIANAVADWAIMKDNSDYERLIKDYESQGMTRAQATTQANIDTLSGLAWDGIGGALMGGWSGAAQGAINTVNGFRTYDKAKAPELLSRANKTAEGSEARKLATEYQNKRITNKMAQTLNEAINTADTAALQNAVKEQLDLMGVTENADAIAEAVAKSALGDELTAEQESIVNNDENAKELLRELNEETYTPERVKSGADVDWIYNVGTVNTPTQARFNRDMQELKQKIEEEEKKNPVPQQMDTSVKVNGAEATITGLTQDGKVQAKDANGKAVEVQETDLSESQKKFVDLLNAEYGKQAPAVYSILTSGEGNLRQAYTGARVLMEVARNSNKAQFDQTIRKNLSSSLAALSDKQAQALWSMAQQNQKNNARAKSANFKNTVTGEAVYITNKDGTKTRYEGYDFSSDNPDIVNATFMADALAGAAKGKLSFNFYHGGESKTFGWHQGGRIDVNVDRIDGNGKSAVVWTMSHELTHFIKDYSPKKYKKLSSVMIDHIMESEGKTLEQLINEKKARDTGISEEEAIDEIVADGCEKMLENTEIFNKLAQKDASLAKEVANHIKSFLKSLYEGITKQHHESKVAEKYIKEMQSIWDDALEDALTAEDGTAEPGESRFAKADRSKRTFKKDKNSNGVFTMSYVIDFANSNKQYWTDAQVYDIFSMNDREMSEVFDNIYRLTKAMNDYEENKVVDDDDRLYSHFTVSDGKNEFRYYVALDGYLHGEILEKVELKVSKPFLSTAHKEFNNAANFRGKDIDFSTGKYKIVRRGQGLYIVESEGATETDNSVLGMDAESSRYEHQRSTESDVQNEKGDVKTARFSMADAETEQIISELQSEYDKLNNQLAELRQNEELVALNEENRGKKTIAERREYGKKLKELKNRIGLTDVSDQADETYRRLALAKRLAATFNYPVEQFRAELQNVRKDIREYDGRIKEIQDSNEYKTLFENLVADFNTDNTDAFNQYAKDSGLAEAVSTNKLLNTFESIMTKLMTEKENESLNADKQKAIDKSGLDEAEYNRKEAVKEFGYTPYFYDAGYILPNGKMLNFSGEKGKHFGTRGQDHRAISAIYPELSGSKAMLKFMSEGNIRIMAESPGIDLNNSVEPTAQQYSQIRKFANEMVDEGYFNIDFTDADGRTIGSIAYQNVNAARIVNDIKHYYSTGEVREQSVVSQFRFSVADVNETELAQRLEESEKARVKLDKALVAAQRSIEHYKNELKNRKPGQKTARPDDVKKFARDILSQYPYTSVKAADIYDRVQQIADGFIQEKDTSELYKIALDIATEVINNSYVRFDSEGNLLGLKEGYTFADELKDRLKGKIYISPDDAKDAATYLGYENFRQLKDAMRSKGIDLTTNVQYASRSVDSVYTELHNDYNGIFEEQTNVAEELKTLSQEVTEEIVNPYYDDSKSELANLDIDFVAALAGDILDGAIGEDVRQYYTAMEKAEQKRIKEQGKAADKLNKRDARYNEMRDKKDAAIKNANRIGAERVQNVREEKNKKIADLRKVSAERYKELRNAKNKKIAEVRKEGIDKRRALIKRYKENREKREIRDKIYKLKFKADQMVLRGNKNSYVPPHLMRAVSEMCSILTSSMSRGIDARQERLDQRLAEAGIDAANHAERSERLKQTAEKLGNLQDAYYKISQDEDYNYLYSEALNGMLTNLRSYLGGTHLYDGDLSVDDLAQIYNMMDAVMYTVTNATKATALEAHENLKEFAQRFSDNIDGASAKRGLLNNLSMWQMRPDTFFKYICGFAKNNAGVDIQKMFVQGTERKLTMQRDFYNIMRSVTENEKFAKQYAEMTHDPLKNKVSWGLYDEDGNAVSTSRGMMLQAYMLLEQEDSFKSLRIGGFRLANDKQYYHGDISGAYGQGSVLSERLTQRYGELNREIRDLRERRTEQNAAEIDPQIEELLDETESILMEAETKLNDIMDNIRSQLTEFDYMILKAAREWYDYSGEKLDEVNLDMYGFKKRRPNNYTPIHRDLTSVTSVDIRSIQDTVNLENFGSNKDRVKATSPILLTDIFFELDSNQQKMSNFYGFVKVQNDFNKIYKMKVGTQSVEGKIARKFGNANLPFTVSGTQYIENYVRSVAGGVHEKSVFGGIVGNTAQATLTLNPRVALSQLASIPTAAASLGWGNVVKGFGKGMQIAFSKSAKEELMNNNVWFWQRYRGEGGMVEIADAKANRGNAVGRLWNDVASTTAGKMLFNWSQNMDVLATASMWAMAEEAAKSQGYDIKTDEGKAKVNELYTETIRTTQPNYTATERSDLLRDHRDGMKILTMYKTQSNQNFNILMEATGEYNRMRRDFKEHRNGVTKADVDAARQKLANASTAVVLGGSVAFAALRFAASLVIGTLSGYRDDDDELTGQSITKGLVKDMGSSLTGMFALSGNLYDFFYSAFSGENYYGISDTAVSTISNVMTNTYNLVQKALDEDKDIEWADVNKEITSMCNAFGIPYSNTLKILDAVRMYYNDIKNDTFGKFEGNIERTQKQEMHRMLNAYSAGDLEKLDNIREDLIADQDATTEWKKEQKVEDALKTQAKKWFTQDDAINAEDLRDFLLNYCGVTERDVDGLIDEWTGIKDEGYDYGEAKKAFVSGEMSEDELRIYMTTYKGLKGTELDDAVTNVKCEKETGYAYSDLKAAYIDGAITARQAADLRVKYGKQDREKAEELVLQWRCEKDTGIPYTEIQNAYIHNEISKAQVKSYVMKYGGKSEEDADDIALKYEFNKQYPEYKYFSTAQAKSYRDMEDLIKIDDFAEYLEVSSNTHSDKTESGKTISGSRKTKMLEYFVRAGFSYDQAVKLYEREGWSMKSIKDLQKAYGIK